MIPKFNLVDEAWIPVLDRHGTWRELGLRAALAQAHELQCVAAPTPLETAAILRLLLAVLHRTHDTSSREAWGAVWRSGRFNEPALADYWRRWSDRFDLFDPQRPFYQQRTDRKRPVSTASFFPGLAASDHYNHAVQLDERALSPAQAVRDLLVAQAYGLSGGCLPSEKLSHKASPGVAGLSFFVECGDLFTTLACNLLRYDEVSPSLELARTPQDRPNWEADDPYQPRTQILGYLDYLTWPSRRVWLVPEMQAGSLVVRSYIDFVGIAPPPLLDPFKFYRREEKSKNATGYIPLYLNQNKAAWRNSAAILRLHTDRLRPPIAISWLADLRRQGALDAPRANLVGYGMLVENQTKVIIMRREAFPLPFAYLDQSQDPDNRLDLLTHLDQAIQQAEQVGLGLGSAISKLAEHLYPRPKADAKEKLNPDQRKQVDRIANSISTKSAYWAALERPYFQLVLDLSAAGDPALALKNWQEILLKNGRSALAEAEQRAGANPKSLKAGVLARGLFEWKLREAGLISKSLEGEQNVEIIL